MHLHYKEQLLNAVQQNELLSWEPHENHKYTCGKNAEFLNVNPGGTQS
jgi:hypothetical protein